MSTKSHSNRDVITLHLGNFGCKVGFCVWKLFCKEHGVLFDGTLDPNFKNEEATTRTTVFNENSKGVWTPKTLFIDQCLGMMDELHTGIFSQLFDIDQFYTPNLTQNGIYAAVKYSTELAGATTEICNKIRQLIEKEDAPTSSILFRSTCGGNGALSPNILKYVGESALVNAVVSMEPSHTMSNRICDPYNHVICTVECLDHADVFFPLQNSALLKKLKRYVGCGQDVTFSQFNDLIAWTVMHLTPDRFIPNENTIPMSLELIVRTSVCFPQLKFIVLRTGRTHTFDCGDYGVNDKIRELLVTNLIDGSALCDNVDSGVHITLCLAFRGSGLKVSTALDHVRDYRNKLVKNKQFISWMPYFTKIGLVPYSVDVPNDWGWIFSENSMVGFDNTTGMEENMKLALDDFSKLFITKSFLHLYSKEGMELGEFENAYTNLMDVATYYESLESLYGRPGVEVVKQAAGPAPIKPKGFELVSNDYKPHN